MDNSMGGITTMRQELTEDELKYLARDLTMYKIGMLTYLAQLFIICTTVLFQLQLSVLCD